MSVARLLFPAIVGAALTTLPHPAVARPRDDVMSKAFRCAMIGDTRTWLDCYYGAAQPAREVLGMSAAPAGQVKLVTDPPHGVPSKLEVEIRDEVLSGAFACKTASDDRQWLNCYYAAAQPARAHLGLPSDGRIPQPPASAKTLTPPASFGVLAARQSEIPDTADHISARLASYSFDTYGIFTVVLANGQVWKQISGDTTFAHWTKPATTYTARLNHGFLGSYNLTVAGTPGVFKVERVQ